MPDSPLNPGPPPPYEAEETVVVETLSGASQYFAEEELTQPVYSDEPRRADLTLARIDAWSVLKASFLVSIALGIAIVVATIVLWFFLDNMGVFGAVEDFLSDLNAERFLQLMDYLRLPRVVSYATILGVANVVIFTAMTTLIALLYNVIAALVGGVQVSLMDE